MGRPGGLRDPLTWSLGAQHCPLRACYRGVSVRSGPASIPYPTKLPRNKG